MFLGPRTSIILKAETPPHLTTLIVLTALSTLSLNMFIPSLASIADDLEADYGTVSLAVAGYLAVTAVIQLGVPIYGVGKVVL